MYLLVVGDLYGLLAELQVIGSHISLLSTYFECLIGCSLDDNSAFRFILGIFSKVKVNYHCIVLLVFTVVSYH